MEIEFHSSVVIPNDSNTSTGVMTPTLTRISGGYQERDTKRENYKTTKTYLPHHAYRSSSLMVPKSHMRTIHKHYSSDIFSQLRHLNHPHNIHMTQYMYPSLDKDGNLFSQ